MKKHRHLCLITVASFVVMYSFSVQAHNKVVVIPLAGDDVVQAIEPFAPLAAASPATSDYIIMTDTVIDNVTGLEWQRQDDDIERTWDAAWDYCANLSLDSKDDWRLPSYYELQSIIDYGAFDPAINTIAFTNTNIGTDEYWTATSYYFNSSRAWSFGGDVGDINFGFKTDLEYARCVRSNGNVAAWAGVFNDNNNGSVTDLATGLIWQAEDDNVRRTHANALSYCSALSLAGSSNWRLPTVKELNSIVDLRNESPAINSSVFPDTNSSFYWSASSWASSSATAWLVSFDIGGVFSGNKTFITLVRCVR